MKISQTLFKIYSGHMCIEEMAIFNIQRAITLRPNFKSKLVHVLAFGILKFYIAPYDKIIHELANLSSNCDLKLGLKVGKQELRFMCSACHLMVFNICVKFHENMSSGFKLMKRT